MQDADFETVLRRMDFTDLEQQFRLPVTRHHNILTGRRRDTGLVAGRVHFVDQNRAKNLSSIAVMATGMLCVNVDLIVNKKDTRGERISPTTAKQFQHADPTGTHGRGVAVDPWKSSTVDNACQTLSNVRFTRQMV